MVCTDDMLKSTMTSLQPSILYYHSLTAKDTIRFGDEVTMHYLILVLGPSLEAFGDKVTIEVGYPQRHMRCVGVMQHTP